jgi:hypothetical protein
VRSGGVLPGWTISTSSTARAAAAETGLPPNVLKNRAIEDRAAVITPNDRVHLP